ncbi:MAG: nuclear transport factor 2 family protein [Ginsengibacter sp.]
MHDLPKLMLSRAVIIIFLLNACSQANKIVPPTDTVAAKNQISALLDSFNVAAAKADYDRYFDYYTDDAIFTGTDATERWDKKEFMVWAKPYFDKGHTWNFKAIDRHIYFDSTGNTAWFDELLNTQMKICRGSGVLVKVGNEWKMKQYILSATIPNDLMDSVVTLKAPIEDSIIKSKQN